jgi:hypothetical protein
MVAREMKSLQEQGWIEREVTPIGVSCPLVCGKKPQRRVTIKNHCTTQAALVFSSNLSGVMVTV